MPNDAKIGLAVGVTLVIAAAVLFGGNTSPDASAPAPVGSPPAIPSPHTHPPTPSSTPARATATRHVVRDGETLTELARHYYGDRSQSLRIYHTNRDQLLSPDRLPPGTVLVIPEPNREE